MHSPFTNVAKWCALLVAGTTNLGPNLDSKTEANSPAGIGCDWGDLNYNGEIDLTDLSLIESQGCFNGPDVIGDEACSCGDINQDGTTDLLDFAEFQVTFGERLP